MSVYITQLIYIKDGEAETFDQFEAIAIPTIQKYNGLLLLRMRPSEKEIIEQNIERPYEVHLVSFDTDADFERFMRDEERKKFLHLKEQSIRSVVLIKGVKIG